MNENKNDEFEVTMSRKTQDKTRSSEHLSTGFRKMDRLGSKSPIAKTDIPKQIIDTISTDTAEEQNRKPVQEIKPPVLNIREQVQTDQLNVTMVMGKDDHSEVEKEAIENEVGEATKKVSDSKKDDNPQKKRNQILAVIVAAVVVFIVILLWPCKHEWIDATCTTPKVCSKCDTVEGTPLGHSWENATCTKPSVCQLCKETEGKALGHKWKETEEYDYINSKIIKYSVCNTCKTKENKTTTKLNTLLGNDKTRFYISPADFIKRLNRVLNDGEYTKGYQAVWAEGEAKDISVIEVCNREGIAEALIAFYYWGDSDIENIEAQDRQKTNYTVHIMLMTVYYHEDMYHVLQSFIKTCDPESESGDTMTNAIIIESMDDPLACNDIVYSTNIVNRSYVIRVTPQKFVESLS